VKCSIPIFIYLYILNWRRINWQDFLKELIYFLIFNVVYHNICIPYEECIYYCFNKCIPHIIYAFLMRNAYINFYEDQISFWFLSKLSYAFCFMLLFYEDKFSMWFWLVLHPRRSEINQTCLILISRWIRIWRRWFPSTSVGTGDVFRGRRQQGWTWKLRG